MNSVADLEEASRTELVAHYKLLLGGPPPMGLSTPMLRRIVAYECQANENGKLPQRFKKQLVSITEEDRTISPTVRLKSGARLVREWNGVTHVVDRLTDGFAYRGRVYRSLSAIAKQITGAKWSGPRFFGLKKSQ